MDSGTETGRAAPGCSTGSSTGSVTELPSGTISEPDNEDARLRAMRAALNEFKILADFSVGATRAVGIHSDRPRALCDWNAPVPVSIQGFAVTPHGNEPRVALPGLRHRATRDWVAPVPISINGLAAGAQVDEPRATLTGLIRPEPVSEARLETPCCWEVRLPVDNARGTGTCAANDATCSFAEHGGTKPGLPSTFVGLTRPEPGQPEVAGDMSPPPFDDHIRIRLISCASSLAVVP